MTLTPEEAIKEFESELKWAELNTYPYVSKQKIEADKMAIEAINKDKDRTLDIA
jgi:cytochrome c2